MPIELTVVGAMAEEAKNAPQKSAGAFVMPVNTYVQADSAGDEFIHITFRASDLDQCRKSSVRTDEKSGTTKGGNYGFMVSPQILGCFDADWDVVLKPGWVSLAVVPKGARV